MSEYYGQAKEEIKLTNLLKRLDMGKEVSKLDIRFIERKLQERRYRKFWPGADFFRDGIERAIKRLKYGNRENKHGNNQSQKRKVGEPRKEGSA